MNQIIFRLLLLLLPLCGLAQRTTPYFGEPVRRYLNNAEADSIMFSTLQEVFEDNGSDSGALRKAFGSIKPVLMVQVQGMYSSRLMAAVPPSKKAPAAGTEYFNRVKADVHELFATLVEQQFSSSLQFKRYLGLSVSDRITHFHAKVTVQENGKLLVEETIRVYNGNGAGMRTPGDNRPEEGGGNNEIKRGIIRSFPTVYQDKFKLNHRTTFKLISVKRKDIGDEEWSLKTAQNGYNLYLGSSGIFLPNGFYTYVITYETDRQIKFLEDYDELNWNITGNGWSFRIDSASCTIILPDSARIISGACYTGAYGSTDKNCNLDYVKGGKTIFTKTMGPLKPKQGISIAVSWQKGMVHNNEARTAYLWRMFRDNQAVFLMPLFAILMLVYNFIVWYRVGRDPKPGVVYPEYYPPKGLSPAAMGYVYEQGFDNRLVAATITDWAVKKYITIDVSRKGFIFKKNVYKIRDGGAKLKDGLGYDDYYDDSDELEDTTIEKGKYNKSLGSFRTELISDLEGKYKATQKNFFKGLFRLNNWYMAPGNLMIVLGFFYIIFGIFTRPLMRNPWQLIHLAVGMAVCIIIQNIFYRLMKAYTAEGRQVMDKIEGFRMFLKAADEDRINFVNPPAKNLALYEQYLPFAIALNCEIEWGNQFEDIIKSAAADPDSGSVGSHSFSSSFSNHNFSSSFAGSLSGAISSASTPPSSSSGGGGSFGGGSSGGGGGGGGGGGW